MKVKTLEEAFEFVQSVGLCTLFSGKVKGVRALWDVVDLPDRKGGRTKWGERVEAIWAWKNELPETYPDDIFYGKIQGGNAALMSMSYLKETHHPKFRKRVEECSELAQGVFELVRLDSGTTGELRREAIRRFGCSKSRFDTALKQLQVTLNIARSNEPGLESDTWVRFDELYGESFEIE
ncbi:MAG: hypothetical protein AAGB46_07600 [Verrucomicrobiota bacterium]